MAVFSRGENTFLFFFYFPFPTVTDRWGPPTRHATVSGPAATTRPASTGGSSAPRIVGPTPERLHPGADATPLALSLTLAPLPALSPPPPAQSAARHRHCRRARCASFPAASGRSHATSPPRHSSPHSAPPLRPALGRRGSASAPRDLAGAPRSCLTAAGPLRVSSVAVSHGVRTPRSPPSPRPPPASRRARRGRIWPRAAASSPRS